MHEDMLSRSKVCRGRDPHGLSVMIVHDHKGASSLKFVMTKEP